MITELIGILAALMVFASFTQSNLKHVRILNIFGCLLFVLYGLLKGALSVWLLNLATLVLQIYKLNRSE